MSGIAIVYLITGIASIVVALLLAYWARSMSPANIERKRRRDEYTSSNISADEFLQKTVFEEISGLADSRQVCQEVTERVSNIFSKELEKKVNLTTQELSKRYETIIKEKAQNEEIAWKKYNKTLTEKQETEAVIRSIAEGLVVVDSQGKVVMMNPAAEKLLGVSKKDKIGKSISENLREEQLISLIKGSADKAGREIELISSQDETKKILKASSAVVENEYGQTVGMVSVLSDITKQKELDQLKSNFVANVSHELRTPLVAIEKSISLILGRTTGEISVTQEQFLVIAERNLKRLSRLINDLLDLSKLEAGKMELKLIPSSIEKVINESVESLDTWAKTKSIKIEKRIQEAIPQVNMDPDRIIQVLNNLIGNAIKFTPQDGNITIEAKLREEKREIEVSVQDTGIGIPKEAIAKVFDKFYQIGERVATDISGTGIGLSIAKEAVELHRGKIWVESQNGQGAKFTFTLPYSF